MALRQHIHWATFVVLLGISLTLLFRFNAYQGSVWFSAASASAGAVAQARAEVEMYAFLKAENARLTEQNLALQQKMSIMRWRLRQAKHVPDATERRLAEQMKEREMIAARVVSNSVAQRDNLLTISAGSAEGVEKDMGVVSARGVVGIVHTVGVHHSTVIPILNSRSSISCRLRRSGHFGYLRWEGGSPLVAWLDDVPHHAKVEIGDEVETSGFSDIFPEGIFVGRVTGKGYTRDGQALRLRVALSTDMSRLTEVMVVRREADEQE